MGKLTQKSKDALLKALQDKLDTRDKRYMFLKVCFKELLPLVNIEGSPVETSWAIYKVFENNNMLGSLIACMNTLLDTDLYLETINSNV